MPKNDILPLTSGEQEVFNYIVGYIVDNKYSPTRKEIAEYFDITPQGAEKYVKRLKEKCRISTINKRGKRQYRNIVIIKN